MGIISNKLKVPLDQLGLKKCFLKSLKRRIILKQTGVKIDIVQKRFRFIIIGERNQIKLKLKKKTIIILFNTITKFKNAYTF